MGKRKNRGERREEILQASLELIHEEGFKDFTVRKLAERVNLSEAGVYRHFDDKEEIIEKTAEKVFSTELLASKEVEFESPEEMLRGMLETLFSRLEDNPEATAIIFQGEVFAEYPEIREMFREHRKEKESRIKAVVEQGQESGSFDEKIDSEIAATIITGSVMMTVKEWREEGFSYSLTDKADELKYELSKILEP